MDRSETTIIGILPVVVKSSRPGSSSNVAVDDLKPQAATAAKTSSSGVIPTRCECCGFIIDNEILPLNCNTLEFLHLGMTYPFYFDFIKQCIALLIVQIIIQSVPSIIINIGSDSCKEFKEQSFICSLSFLNILSPTTNDTQQ